MTEKEFKQAVKDGTAVEVIADKGAHKAIESLILMINERIDVLEFDMSGMDSGTKEWWYYEGHINEAVKIKALAIELAGPHMFTLSERKEVHS